MPRAPRVARLAFLAILLLVPGGARLWVHPLSVSYSRFVVKDRHVEATIRLPLDDMDLLLRLDRDLDGTVSDEEIQRARPTVERYLSQRISVVTAGSPLTLSLRTTATWKDRDGFPYLEATAAYAATQAIDEIAVQVRVLTDLYADHRNLAEVALGERRDQFVFQHGNTYSATLATRDVWQTAESFVLLGIEHIFTGYDHVLFLFGLLLVGRGFKNLVAIVTSFTVAHSLTLALATLGAVEPVAWTIEAAIALSIAYIGFENLVVRDVRHRWKIAFVFGLVHGFGFANVLREMHLPRSGLAVSLFTFNLGVEIGQALIVALMLPLLRFLERTPYRTLVTRVASMVIIAFGLFWFYQRVTDDRR